MGRVRRPHAGAVFKGCFRVSACATCVVCCLPTRLCIASVAAREWAAAAASASSHQPCSLYSPAGRAVGNSNSNSSEKQHSNTRAQLCVRFLIFTLVNKAGSAQTSERTGTQEEPRGARTTHRRSSPGGTEKRKKDSDAPRPERRNVCPSRRCSCRVLPRTPKAPAACSARGGRQCHGQFSVRPLCASQHSSA